MNHNSENTETIGLKPTAAAAGDEVQTERLPPGRQLELQRRRPKSLLLSVIALTILFACALLVIRAHRPSEQAASTPSPGSGAETSAPDNATPAESAANALARRIDQLSADLAEHSRESARRIEENNAATRALADKLETLPATERVAALEDALKQLRDQIAKDLSRVEQSLARSRKPTVPKMAPPTEPALPFEPTSLDLWDGVPYVSLLQDRRVESLHAGQAQAGWTIEDIDYGTGKVRFRNESGQAIDRIIKR